MRPLLLVLCFSFWLLGSACAPRSAGAISSITTPRASAPGRVAVLPFWLADGVGRSAESVSESMSASLRELALHEVVTVSLQSRARLLSTDVLYGNRLSTDDLLRLRDALQCDSVLLGRVEQFQSFDPVAIGVSLHLVSCHDGEKLWEATAHFDGARKEVQADLERWYRSSAGANGASVAGWQAALSSPRLFSRYATDRLASTIPYKP